MLQSAEGGGFYQFPRQSVLLNREWNGEWTAFQHRGLGLYTVNQYARGYTLSNVDVTPQYRRQKYAALLL